MFIQNGKKNKLFFHSSKERESYYKKYLKSNEKYSNFKRYSVCSKTKPTKHTAFVRFFKLQEIQDVVIKRCCKTAVYLFRYTPI